ncbi:MAG: ribosomal-processing cysteine protease Prp [Lachnospiraceae bacterium]|nr:ribosomal-processing cysteine protease Prp [Lachnospiraceae bacterium]
MIEVSVRKDGITISGHSGYAPPGQDIVCAGVSTLAQTLISSIEDLTQDKITYSVSPGRADINYGNLSEKSQTLVDSFFVGICAIVNGWSDYVRVV